MLALNYLFGTCYCHVIAKELTHTRALSKLIIITIDLISSAAPRWRVKVLSLVITSCAPTKTHFDLPTHLFTFL